MKSLENYLSDNIFEAAKNAHDFVDYLKSNGGMVPAQSLYGGPLYYFCKILNDENFDLDARPKFKQQLKDEGLYNRCYASGLTETEPGKKISTDVLLIFGDSNRYVTKWFTHDMFDAVNRDLRDRQMGLKKRLEFFK